jgi:hypothetical protein
MLRRHRRDLPRWRRGHAVIVRPVQLSGRQARQFAREYARVSRTGPATAGSTVARTGAWRFRRHLVPFAWLAVTLTAAAALRVTPRPVPYAAASAVVAAALLVWATRHLSSFARRATELAALVTLAWLPVLTAAGFSYPVRVSLAVTWAPFTVAWVRHYAWRPAAAQQGKPAADKSDAAVWERLAKRRKWSGTLGPREAIPGGRKYPILLDGAETHIGQVMSDPRAIAAAFDKPLTEAYPEPHPSGVESRGYLTILKSGTLDEIREWDGQGITAAGFASAARFADGQPARLRFWVPRDGTRHSLIAGTSGAGKSVLLDLLVWLAITSEVPVVPVILDPQNGQSLPQWRGKVPYASGLDECMAMLTGLHNAMLLRSRDLAIRTWTDEDGYEQQGFEFFDAALTSLPVVMPIIDEAPMILNGGGNSKRAAVAVQLVGDMAKLARKTGLSVQLVAQVPSLSELGDQSLRSMLVGGNVVCLRTGDRVSAGMLGLDVDPSALPKYFPSGEPTGGLGYAIGPDNRQAPMRVSPVPSRMRRAVPAVAEFDESFDAALHAGMVAWHAFSADAEKAVSATAADSVPADDSPEGRRCADAVWQVLADSGQPMERGEIIRWVSELATTGWGREKPFSIRSVTNALNTLLEGDGGRVIVKVRDGVYQVTDTQLPRDNREQGTA